MNLHENLMQETCASSLCKFLDCVSPPVVTTTGSGYVLAKPCVVVTGTLFCSKLRFCHPANSQSVMFLVELYSYML